MSDIEKNELIEIVQHLPPTKVIQLLEPARRLQSPGKRDQGSVLEAIAWTRGKYRDILNSSEEFAARKREERVMKA